jgi:hypothetical protein
MVDREGECTAIVQWKFIDASTPREKKRIRTETTALACKPCGKKVRMETKGFFFRLHNVTAEPHVLKKKPTFAAPEV